MHLTSYPFFAQYNATDLLSKRTPAFAKAGVRLLSKSVALYCAKKGYDVRCNSVHPAFVNTPILDPIKQAFGAEEAVAKLARQIPMNKIGDTDDVSYAILYLASDESKFMTGTEIVLDGGLSAM